jgi:hypothetical protein
MKDGISRILIAKTKKSIQITDEIRWKAAFYHNKEDNILFHSQDQQLTSKEIEITYRSI